MTTGSARVSLPSSARRIVNLRAPESVQKRIEQLAVKSREGTLKKDEREEYEAFVSAGNFIAILQSKARRLIQDHKS